MTTCVIYLGGNGHCAARLGPARAALERLALPLRLIEPALPGFENRPRAPHLDAFLDHVASQVAPSSANHRTVLLGTGIGGLLALCLRARGDLRDVPLLLQAPVLWGLEHRLMPRLMRLGVARLLLARLFANRCFQNWFVRQQFLRPLSPELHQAFFQGYADCSAAADFFRWLTPALLRKLESDFRHRRSALERIRLWWGGRDRVVDLQELAWTRAALDIRWPVRTFPDWGHYPMIDEPDDWLRALADDLATAGEFS